MQTWDITASRKAVSNSRKSNLLGAIFKSSSGGIPWCKAGEEVSQFSFWLQTELAVFSTSHFKILFWAIYTFHKLTVWAEILYPRSCLVIKHTHTHTHSPLSLTVQAFPRLVFLENIFFCLHYKKKSLKKVESLEKFLFYRAQQQNNCLYCRNI